jgi:hypothetical protein
MLPGPTVQVAHEQEAPMRRTTAISMLVLALSVAAIGACDDDRGDPDPTTTVSTATSSTSTTDGADADPALTAHLLEPADLPSGFTESDTVDDTITAFCAGEDAAGGLQASARAARGFTRSGGGASVIQLAFRFRDDGAATFVAQAAAILERCDGVPDATGLAFEYEPLPPEVESPVAGAGDTHTGRYGVNVGSGSLTIELVVLQQGDIGQLVAVLGVDLPRAELDALATAAFTAMAGRG